MAKPKSVKKPVSKSTAKSRPAASALPHLGDRDLLERIVAGLGRLAPPVPEHPDLDGADAFIWQMQGSQLVPVPRVNRVEMELLHGIDRMRDTLLENTERFAKGLPANNALLWGARGMGKSSLVKAAHASVNKRFAKGNLKLIEIHRE